MWSVLEYCNRVGLGQLLARVLSRKSGCEEKTFVVIQ
jgi:hypothetical protein